jgi:hypothetical protein
VTLPKALDLDRLEGLRADWLRDPSNITRAYYTQALFEDAPALIAAARELTELRVNHDHLAAVYDSHCDEMDGWWYGSHQLWRGLEAKQTESDRLRALLERTLPWLTGMRGNPFTIVKEQSSLAADIRAALGRESE